VTKKKAFKEIILSPQVKQEYDQVDRLLETDNSLISDSQISKGPLRFEWKNRSTASNDSYAQLPAKSIEHKHKISLG
jgi:hypothetical protein